jgi:hypothetical protein
LHQRSLRPVIEKDFSQLPDLITKADQMPEYVEQKSEDENGGHQLSLF